MALKGIIFSVLLGAAGTTSAAIPIAGKYGRDRVKEEIEAEELKRERLQQLNKTLGGLAKEANNQRDAEKDAQQKAENEKTRLTQSNQSLEQQRNAQKARAIQKEQEWNNYKRNYDQVNAQKQKLEKDLKPLQDRNQDLKTQLTTKDEEIRKAKEEMNGKVVSYINDKLSNLSTFDFWSDDRTRIYERGLMKWIGDDAGRPWDKEPNKWNCKHTIDSRDDQFGIAYCVL